MKNYKKIRRIFEETMTSVSPDTTFVPGANPQMEEPQMEEPQMDQQTASQIEDMPSVEMNPMTMTVADFIEKCKTIDPLICMGIETFIEKNKEQLQFGASEEPMPASDEINFSNAIEPKPNPDEINFSNVVPPAPADMNMAPPAPVQNFQQF